MVSNSTGKYQNSGPRKVATRKHNNKEKKMANGKLLLDNPLPPIPQGLM
jgi:hypothetical protein